MKRFKLVLILLVFAALPLQAEVIEDFDDVSDWTIEVGPSALSGSVSQDASQARDGDYAGLLNYEHSTAVADDYILYMKDFSENPLDISEPGLALQMKIKVPNDPDFLLQIRMTDGSSWGDFIEHDFSQGWDGTWQLITLPLDDSSIWADYGYAPDLSNIVNFRFTTNGDLSSNYTADSIVVDTIEFVTVDDSVMEDFEDVSDWQVSVGPNADSASITSSTEDYRSGVRSGVFNYGLSTEQGFDYIDYYRDNTTFDLSGADELGLHIKVPEDTDMQLFLQLYSSNGGFMEYEFTDKTGEWQTLTLSLSSDFAIYGDPLADMSSINLVRFRIIGDCSATATVDSFYVDQLTSRAPQCSGLEHDTNGDCKVDYKDFAGFANEWLQTGTWK